MKPLLRSLDRQARRLVFLAFSACSALAAAGAGSGEPWWTWRNPLPQGNQFSDIAVADGRYVAVGRGGTIFASSDGVAWTPRVSGVGVEIRFVVRGNGVWVACAGDRTLTSVDGLTWFVNPPVPELRGFSQAVFFAGKFLAADPDGRIWASTDGATWTVAYAQTGSYFTGIAAGDGRVLAVGRFLGKVSAVGSTDGVAWTDLSASLADVVTDSYGARPIRFVNNRWFLFGSSVQTSTDAVTWTRVPLDGVPNDLAFGNGRYVAVVSASALVSADLTAWTKTDLPVGGGAREARAITYGPAGFTAVGAAGSIFSSADGTTWVNRATNRMPDNLRRIAYADGRWLVAGEAGVYASDDGVAWDTAATFASREWGSASVAYGNGLALASGGGPTLLRSTDRGVTWTGVSVPPGKFNQLAFLDGRFVAVVDSQRLKTSADGLSWTESQGLPANAGSFSHVAKRGDRWVALGVRSGPVSDQAVLATSTDAINWSLLPDGILPSRSYAFAEGGGLVVACPQENNITPTIYASTDGLTWSRRASLPYRIGPIMALGHTEQGFVGLTAFGYTIFSSDGTEWSATPSTGDFIYNDVAAGGGSVLAVGNNSVVLQSGLSRFVANSTRAITANTEEVLIAGFVITGDTAKRVLIRSLGPSLADHGVAGVLPDPELVLFRGQTRLAANTDWRTAADAAALADASRWVGAVELRADRTDSALLLDLNPGVYTAHVRSAGGTGGVAIVEVYEVGETKSRLVAISTRAVVKTGSAVTIPGMVISGDRPKRVLLRAVGPTLRDYGVSAVLERPRMSLMLGTRAVATNTGWSNSADAAELAAAAARVGAFPLPTGSRDSALLVTLNPGIYTTIVEGVGETSGIALIEVYEVD